MILLICGMQGSGKTLLSASMLKGYHEQGYKIYSNISLAFDYEPIDYMKIINCEYEHAVIYLDEIHLLLPSRRSMSKSSVKIVDGFLSMSSKKDLIIIGTTQTPNKVDLRIRDESSYNFLCTKYAWDGVRFKQTSLDAYKLKDTPVIIDVMTIEVFTEKVSHTYLYANDYYDLYDRYEIVRITGLDEYNSQPKKKPAKADE
jgi:GTPase SAR1 family protein